MFAYQRPRPTIGVLAGWQVFSGTIDSFLEHVIRGIQAAAAARECNLLLACGASTRLLFETGRPAWPLVDERVDFLPVGAWNCDGLIVIPSISFKVCEEYAAGLIARGFPVIYAGMQGYGSGVVLDNFMGVRNAIRHLYEHGHRRIAFVAGYDYDHQGDSGIRLQAYRQALAEFDLPFDEDLVAYGSHQIVKSQEAMRQILARGAPFSAVLGSNDLGAMGAAAALRQAGYQIPQDVAVIGFDNRIETRAHTPPLTTVHFPMYELGYLTLEMMFDRLEGRVGPRETRLIPSELVIRESCGCSPGETGKFHPQGNQPVSVASSERPISLALDGGRAALSALNEKMSEDFEIEQEMVSIVLKESYRTRREEAVLLSRRCIRAYLKALSSGVPQDFLDTFHEILDRVSAWQDDLYNWQYVITVLRERPPVVPGARLTARQLENMLDQARLMVSDAARAQSTRQLIRQVQVAEWVSELTSAFFTAKDEDEIFTILDRSLPAIGIEQSAVLYFQPNGDDRVAESVLQSPHPSLAKGYRFNTYQFPPAGLFAEQTPFQVALLPITVGEREIGYTALPIGLLEPLSDIVHQLGSSLYAVRLRQQALEGQRMAEDANRLKSRFLSMVSHELRAPLNLISGLSDILLKTKNGKSAGKLVDVSFWDDLERIYFSAQHLDGLIQDVLDMARSDIGQIKLMCEALDLKEVLDSVSAICANLARDKGLAWRYQVATNLPRVWGDRTRLRQVTLNLINNAIKFTEHGEVRLEAGVDGAGRVRVSVSDTGLGISRDEQEMIFEEFRQSERTAERGYGGLGLGLAICKRLVELHGGDISVQSTGHKDQGAVFSFTLPVLAPQSHPVTGLTRPDQAAKSIFHVFLLVKDQAASQSLWQYLSDQGHAVEMHTLEDAETSGDVVVPGDDWLAHLACSGADLVVMDLGTTTQRGWEILRAMKENPATQDTPALFYTESADGRSGALLELDYLTKPVKGDALVTSLLSYHQVDRCGGWEVAPRVLVVDDDANVIDLHTRLLQSQVPNVRVLKASNGREALEIIAQEPPTLVLLDLLMPEMDGFEVLAEMRAQKASRDIPVIVITSQSLDQHDIARLNQGMVSILGKNIFSKEETLEHIASFLQNRRKQSTDAQRTIMKAMAFIHDNYKEPISRRDIAASVGLSELHLDRCFQQGLGISPMTYLNRYRVNQARNLLDLQTTGITVVAMEVGFTSSGYFARVFRDEMGVSPRAYLQKKGRGTPG